MTETKIEAYLAIPMPSIELFEKSNENGTSRTTLYDALEDLCSCTRKLEFRQGAGIVKPEIEILRTDAREAFDKRRLFRKKHLNRCEIVVVSASVPLSFYDDLDWTGEFACRDAAVRLLARVELCKRISDLLVMSNVGRVGAIELLHSAIIQDNCKIRFSNIPEMNGWSIQRAAAISKEMGWPRLDVLEIDRVWQWAVRHNQMLEAFDGTPMGRALSAFSRLFEHKTADEPMQLVWALVGLEALYVRGKAVLGQQVREKSQVLLGKQLTFKKRISQMYDFRSRFVHGDLDFPGLCLIGDAREDVARFDNDLLDSIAVAVAVLVGTVQEIIRRDWSGLQFEYGVADTKEASTANGGA